MRAVMSVRPITLGGKFNGFDENCWHHRGHIRATDMHLSPQHGSRFGGHMLKPARGPAPQVSHGGTLQCFVRFGP
jgi:hypothetical protein